VTLLAITVLALVQGLAELLPVSSSAHVIVAEKLLGLDPTAPEMTLLLVMLHTGTMLAVVVYFWRAWRQAYFASAAVLRRTVAMLFLSTVLTAAVGYPVMWVVKRTALRAIPGADIELVFGNLGIMSAALAAAGLLILWSGLRRPSPTGESSLGWRNAAWIGAVQGLCLPFRGFSRSGATISTGFLVGVGKRAAEEYSFALAVVLTPPVVLREAKRLVDARRAAGVPLLHLFAPGIVGMVLSFLVGLLALSWLSRWIERGAWYRFGIYCLFASAVVMGLYLRGF
jgi:undecaprenyl-diphosphatase